MKYVIQDLQRLSLQFPVICGGAALTRKYVEDDLRREYSNAVFYADDAFTGLHIMDDLTSENGARETRLEDGRIVKQFARAAVAGAGDGSVSTERSTVVTSAPNIPKPPFVGRRVRTDFDLDELFSFINDTALFKNQWQLKTASATDYARLVEEKYRPIKHELQKEVAKRGLLEPKVVYGFYPCHGQGNDVVVYDNFESLREIQRFTFPRQREGHKLCISDFFEPLGSGRVDIIGFSIVTVGNKASEETKRLFDAGEFTKYLYLHGLSVETAEALAEYMHREIRKELGIGGEDAPRVTDLFHQKYRGSRYSFGYPACPNLEDQTKLFAILHPEEIGVTLTDTFQIEPEQSTSAIIVHHPGAKYFVA
jgi:5-methyltetrahydrofolate--homocysteine methyltransferase